ncbi:MAG TPA: DUF4159 domain-containing protein [Polyangiaceae bacterium]|nr:DUF4159 domain-containing protein [Polyangiaceae bacterium]
MSRPTRRDWLLGVSAWGAASAAGLRASPAAAFAEQGAFHARLLGVPGREVPEDARTAASRWAFELVERTSAPGRTLAEVVAVDGPELLQEPFVVWAGSEDPGQLGRTAQRRLAEYLSLGGLLVVDDRAPGNGAFRRGVQREMQRVWPDGSAVQLPSSHVLYKSYYLLERPYGRVEGPPSISAISKGRFAQVLFLEHDLLGALARQGDGWAHEVTPGGAAQRRMAVRFAVNIAMYVLCSDYKDDQVHAPFVMRRRMRG